MSWAIWIWQRLKVGDVGFTLLLATAVLLAVAGLRGAEYDEGYTVFLASGMAKPDWPVGAVAASEALAATRVGSSVAGIAGDLQTGDVHPPLYFWAVAGWRALAGEGLFATRLFSVACALAALALAGAVARVCGVKAVPTMALCLGCYAFTYTGAIARGFALAQMLNLLGVWLVLRGRPAWAGVALGAASFSNYLAVFVAGAVLAWLVLRRAWQQVAAVGLGIAPFLVAGGWFFLAQRGSRTGQFPAFEWGAGLARLGLYAAASVLGGLPLYAGEWRGGTTLTLAAFFLVLVAAMAWGARGLPGVVGLAAIAPPLGLLALGLVFDNTPIEMRYLAFAMPFVALLLAAVLPRPAVAALLAVQVLSLAGMATRAETMQPQAAAARAAATLAGANGVVLVPRGNDGVGVAGVFLLAAQPALRVMVVEKPPPEIPARRVVLALLELDRESRITAAALRAAFEADPCWRLAAEAANLRAFDRVCGG